MITNVDAWPNPASRPHPHAVINGTGLGNEIKCAAAVVMISCAEESALRDAYIVADGDPVKVQKPALFTKPNVIANGQFPRKRDLHLRFNDDAVPDLCPE